MKISEHEFEKYWCPHARPEAPRVKNDRLTCIGDKCAAWCWLGGDRSAEGDNYRFGYCGMIGPRTGYKDL